MLQKKGGKSQGVKRTAKETNKKKLMLLFKDKFHLSITKVQTSKQWLNAFVKIFYTINGFDRTLLNSNTVIKPGKEH